MGGEGWAAEIYVTVAGRWAYQYWTTKQFCRVIDSVVARGLATLGQFFIRALGWQHGRLGRRLADHGFARLLTGPPWRATEICLLPWDGASVEACAQLAEWDNGGRTTVDISATVSGWTLL